MRKQITLFLFVSLFLLSLTFVGNPFTSHAVSQNQLIVDGSQGTIPSSLEPYCGTYSCVLPVNNLVGYWSFDDGSGSSAFDNSGNGNTGTLVNSPTWLTGSNCMFGDCLRFNASASQYVNTTFIPESVDYPSTISFWVSVQSCGTVNNPALVGDYWRIALSTTCQLFFLTGAFGNSGAIGTAMGLNDWNFIVMTISALTNPTVVVYQNNTQIFSGSFTGTFGTSDSLDFAYCGNGCDYSNSTIDDVRYYVTALTATQISEIYNNYPSGNGYYSTSSTAFIYTQSQYDGTRLTEYSVDGGTNNTIPNYGSSTLLQYNQPMNLDHHWIFFSTPTTTTTQTIQVIQSTSAFPVSYALLVIWLLSLLGFYSLFHKEASVFSEIMMVGLGVFGMVLAALAFFGGELWIINSGSQSLTLVTKEDGLGQFIGMFCLVIGITLTFLVPFYEFEARKRRIKA